MYAVVRLNVFDVDKLASADGNMQQFNRIHSAQPGYSGTIVVDLGEGRRIVLNLWDSAEESVAALSVPGPVVKRLLVPLMSAPSVLLGAGTVLSSDRAPTAMEGQGTGDDGGEHPV
jgi:hypothetical protein